MKILCLDQSTKVTGWSLWDEKELISFGHVDVNEKDPPFERMKEMVTLIDDLINDKVPDFVVLENIQFQNNHHTYQQLAQMQGVIFTKLFERDLGFTTVEPMTWKAYSKIKGRARAEQKANTIQMVKYKFNIEASEDEADAIGIGLWAINNLKKVG